VVFLTIFLTHFKPLFYETLVWGTWRPVSNVYISQIALCLALLRTMISQITSWHR